jgi:hypothetical protein
VESTVQLTSSLPVCLPAKGVSVYMSCLLFPSELSILKVIFAKLQQSAKVFALMFSKEFFRLRFQTRKVQKNIFFFKNKIMKFVNDFVSNLSENFEEYSPKAQRHTT